ncbi:hypothetical protein EDB84DRAFT_174555 [Lactarius hengduanensis]|nr:hypothetical protein EDB84DRAFT_174555 [Lactarius hengduanensis]
MRRWCSWRGWWSVAVVMVLVDVAWRVAARVGRCCGGVCWHGGWYLVAMVAAAARASR